MTAFRQMHVSPAKQLCVTTKKMWLLDRHKQADRSRAKLSLCAAMLRRRHKNHNNWKIWLPKWSYSEFRRDIFIANAIHYSKFFRLAGNTAINFTWILTHPTPGASSMWCQWSVNNLLKMNLLYIIYVSGSTELRTNKRTDRAPSGPFRPGGIEFIFLGLYWKEIYLDRSLDTWMEFSIYV